MASSRTREDERADLGFGLGKALDELGEYDEAFAVYREANRASRMGAGSTGATYDRVAHERWVDQIIRTFPRPATNVDTPVDSGEPPVFICGMFRSGTSLVEQILSGHPVVTPGGEMDLLPAMVRGRLGAFRDSDCVASMATRTGLRQAYREGIAARYPNAGIVTDKRPDNFLYIGLVKTLFPKAKLIHTRRDPMDNCLSVYFLHLTRAMPYALDLLDIAHWYRQYRRLMQHWNELYPGEIHEVSYDELVASPQPVIERLLAYCRLPWHEGCVNFHLSKAAVQTASVWQVRQPLYTHSSGRWRHYRRHLEALAEALDGMPE